MIKKIEITKEQKEYFTETAREILSSPVVQQMKQYPQHGNTNALCHMVYVAYTAYKMALDYNREHGSEPVDVRSIIRGALLHDLFLYDWHDPNNGHKLHGFSHPYTALKNARRLFFINGTEVDIIKNHMFPFVPIPPVTKEGRIVSMADKFCSTNETLRRKKNLGPCFVCPLSSKHRLIEE